MNLQAATPPCRDRGERRRLRSAAADAARGAVTAPAKNTGPLLRMIVAAMSGALLGGCSSSDYFAHLAKGQYGVLSARRPLDEVIADPATDATLKARLQLAQQARAFASDRLALLHNGSYTLYADVGRPYVAWNVFATAEFSLKPVTHCFLIAGCVGYRGYFDKAKAEAEARELAAQGDDT